LPKLWVAQAFTTAYLRTQELNIKIKYLLQKIR
jgi:hypothetical protein